MLYKCAVLAVLATAVAVTYHMICMLDLNKRVYNHRPGPCRTVKGIEHGAEDIEVIKEKNIAFVSSGINYMNPRAKGVKGQIFLYDFKQTGEEYVAVPLKITGSFDTSNFFPHGISSYVENGKIFLYAINHDRNFKHSFEVFEYIEAERSLRHIRTITDSGFVRPNNLVVLGRDRFIFTNDGITQSSVLSALEMLSYFKTGNVGYYDGKATHILAKSLRMPNGVAIDASREHLVVSSTLAKALFVFRLSKDLKSSKQIRRVELLTAPDNLFLDSTNSVWVASFPIFKECLRYIANPDDRSVVSASQVLRVAFTDSFESWTITEPYVNDGTEVAGCSAAVAHDGQLLLGTVFRTLLRCDIVHSSVV